MSCRRISGTVRMVEGMFHPGLAAAAPSEASVSPEISELHDRILGLERAHQRDLKEAREAGFREGEKAGRERAAHEFQPALDRISRSAAELANLRDKLRREAEADLVTISLAIARRILRRELSVDPEAIQGVVKAALDKLQNRDVCRVRVHAVHAGFVRKQMELAGVAAAAEVQADPKLHPGDLIIETARGDVNASIDSQLAEIERGFADRLGGAA